VIRVKVECIWGLPGASSKAVSYVLVGGGMRGEAFHETWADAMGRANWLAHVLSREAHGMPAFEQQES
jgi:hypothetical protein